MEVQQILLTLLQFGEIELVKKVANLLAKTAERPEEHATMASIFVRIGENKKAIESGERAIAGDNDDIKLNLPAVLYPAYKAEYDYIKAIGIIENLVQMNPENYNLQLEKASLLYETNRKDDAADVLDRINVSDLNDFQYK